MRGRVLNVQRMSTEDGPGIRTTVFLKGCPLRCTWCHNPESLSPRPELVVQESRCIGCGTCREVCPIAVDSRQLTVDRRAGAGAGQGVPDGCTVCGTCARECPGGAREVLGTEWEAGDLARELAKDRAYFGADGGVTVSGGEPTLQAPFVGELLARCGELGIPAALDTCGACPRDVLLGLAAGADLVLYDLKLIDPEAHKRFTGADNGAILANLTALAPALRAAGKALWVRTPLVPRATATRENLEGLGRFLAREVDGAAVRWELCAFNNLCADQYRRLGRTWAHAGEPRMTRETLGECLAWAQGSGVDPGIVHVTGL